MKIKTLSHWGILFFVAGCLFLGTSNVHATSSIDPFGSSLEAKPAVESTGNRNDYQVTLTDFSSNPYPNEFYIGEGDYLRIHHHSCNDPDLTHSWSIRLFQGQESQTLLMETARDLLCERTESYTYTVFLAESGREEIPVAHVNQVRTDAKVTIEKPAGGVISYWIGEELLLQNLFDLNPETDLIISVGDTDPPDVPIDDPDNSDEEDGPGLDGVCPSCSDPLVAVPDPETDPNSPGEGEDADTDHTGVGLGTNDPGDKVISPEDLSGQNITIAGGGLACSLQAKPGQPWGLDFLIFTLLALGLPAGWIWQKR